MLDPLDWVEGWPTVRGGFGASETLSSKPAAQPGEKSSYKPALARPDMPGSLIRVLQQVEPIAVAALRIQPAPRPALPGEKGVVNGIGG